MRPTLFHIPHEIFGLKLFGVPSVALVAWILFCLGLLVLAYRRKAGWSDDAVSFLAVMIGIAVVIAFVLPNLESKRVDGAAIGLPIRGYGTFLLAAVMSSVFLAAYRARRRGLDPDLIYSLALWLFASGIVGARLFFVLQYWPRFQRETISETLLEVVKFTEGGLVVYGSLIGALIAFAIFCRRHKLPMLAIGDLIAPSMLLGLAIGRWGCLMNGCCFGGVCDEGPAITFPAASQPYVHQAHEGRLVGMRLEKSQPPEPGKYVVREASPEGLGSKAGFQNGDIVLMNSAGEDWKRAEENPDKKIPVMKLQSAKTSHIWTLHDLPKRSLPVHPAQIYSSLNAALICLLLLAYGPFRRRDGEVLALMLTIYPITRILLEIVRNDEPGRFGTVLTISQYVSLGMLLIVVGMWVYLAKRPSGLAELAKA